MSNITFVFMHNLLNYLFYHSCLLDLRCSGYLYFKDKGKENCAFICEATKNVTIFSPDQHTPLYKRGILFLCIVLIVYAMHPILSIQKLHVFTVFLFLNHRIKILCKIPHLVICVFLCTTSVNTT